MANWLLKTEPDSYSWDDLVRDKKTTWDGVKNALALKNIRTMKKGDQVLIYHTGDQRTAIGLAEVTSDAYPNPKEDDDRLAVVDLKPKRKLPRGISISDIKADPAFAGWDFLRISRLSVVPVPEKMWKRIFQLAGEKP
ncbi:MAG TPA: EVE domain-containing protein [Tepidisphaeraceae bacterium]|jgi:predicted RNA-binding protein with PUA-like domain